MTTREIGQSDDGGTVDVAVGDTIVLRLPDNPTTGYRWELEPLPAGSVAAGEPTYEPFNDLMGSGGAAQWSLSTVAPGSVTVRLKRWRPWEGESSVIERFALTVTVRD